MIVNWNTGRCLRECLRSLAGAEQTAFGFGTVIVVDNASADNSLDGIERVPLPLHVHRNATNRGFAAACNQGATVDDSELVLFLNPDTRVHPDTLDRSVAFMVDPKHSDVGICGVQMLRADGLPGFSCARFPTLGMTVAKMTGLSEALPGWFRPQRMSPDELGRSGAVDQVIGAYFLTRRSLFALLGGFDERFFVYMEDVDFAYRARQLGHRSHYLVDARADHLENVSSDQARDRRLFHQLRSRTEYARKHWPRWQAPVLAFLFLTVELPARLIVSGVRGRRGEAGEVLGAARRYWRHLRAA